MYICTCGNGVKNFVGYLHFKQAHDKWEIFLLESAGTLKFKQCKPLQIGVKLCHLFK